MTFQNTATVFTGLSSFYELALTVSKTSITKRKRETLKIITYRDYKNCNSLRFTCTKFNEIFLQVLNKHVPLKSKLPRANHASYISKPFSLPESIQVRFVNNNNSIVFLNNNPIV